MTAAPSNPLALLPSVDRFLSWNVTAGLTAARGRQATTTAVRLKALGLSELNPKTVSAPTFPSRGQVEPMHDQRTPDRTRSDTGESPGRNGPSRPAVRAQSGRHREGCGRARQLDRVAAPRHSGRTLRYTPDTLPARPQPLRHWSPVHLHLGGCTCDGASDASAGGDARPRRQCLRPSRSVGSRTHAVAQSAWQAVAQSLAE